MSSQGPATGSLSATGNTGGCYSLSRTSQSTPGYPFNTAIIRDSSDWIRYKKEIARYRDTKLNSTTDPWFPAGNDFRLSWLNGRLKCNGCAGNGFTAPSSVI
jgi:hypothetical protein